MGAPTSYLVLDIETIPDPDLYAPPELPAGVERPFPPLYACRPIVIGVLWLDQDLSVKPIGTIGGGQDAGALSAAFPALLEHPKPATVALHGRALRLSLLP